MTSRNRSDHPSKKPSLFSRIKSGLKRVLRLGKGKKPVLAEEKPAPQKDLGHHNATIHAHKRPAHEKHGHAPEKRDEQPRGERRERSGDRGERRDRGGRDKGPRGERRERGPRDDTPKPVRENHAPVPPPPPPPVPEGPYPENWEPLGLSPAVLAAVRETGYDKPTTIQEKSIPIILTAKDLVGASQTGTGKTAAFALPTITRLGAPGKFRCLVLEPVRELAAQVVEQFEKYGKHTGLRVLLVHGGVGYEKQRKGLQQGVDIVVATPGRLLDFMQEGVADLSNVEVLILDEVDRMLDMGFLPDVRRIVERTPKTRQTLFFSATMPPQIKSLADFALKEPESVEVGIRFSAAETVSHYMYPVASDQREELLLAILKQ
ncbi:MAG: hypothetical protein RLZZ476_2152, partial [Verrucomicrobiota bacterium]